MDDRAAMDDGDVNDPLLPWAAQGFPHRNLTLEPHFAGRNFML